MDGLRVESWEDWEELCCCFMQHLVEKKFGKSVGYQSYGSKGQSQFGIDLVPMHSSLPVVGQCKLRDTTFTWAMVLDELKKTNQYKNPIEHYLLFTTANPHTTVQDVQNRGAYYHKRSDGSQFQVYVYYWRNINIKSLDCVPRSLLERIFPEAFTIAAPTIPVGLTSDQVLTALPAFKACIPRFIALTDLAWLENWNFSCGYVLGANYNPFDHLYLEHDRVVTALKMDISSWLYKDGRMELASALPASERFFTALSDFRIAISSHIIGQTLPNRTYILSLDGLPENFKSKTIQRWKLTAMYLAQVYREDVLGEPRS